MSRRGSQASATLKVPREVPSKCIVLFCDPQLTMHVHCVPTYIVLEQHRCGNTHSYYPWVVFDPFQPLAKPQSAKLLVVQFATWRCSYSWLLDPQPQNPPVPKNPPVAKYTARQGAQVAEEPAWLGTWLHRSNGTVWIGGGQMECVC
jgi:hypothetical protein